MSSSPTFLDPIIIRLLVGESVLDVGCGYGRWGSLIRCNFWEAGLPAPPAVDGIDAFAPNVELCLRQDAYRRVWRHILPEPIDGQWDTVLASEIIEHLPQSDVDRAFAVLEGAARRRVIISTPNWPDIRPGHDTSVGLNDYEAHHSYISRDEFSRRGYKLIGAGFGNPTSDFTNAVFAFNPLLIDILQSLPRAFPSLAKLIVAYKDMDSGVAPWRSYTQSLEGLSLHDLRIAVTNGRTLAYDAETSMFVPADNLSPTTAIFFMMGRVRAFAVTAANGLLTFMPFEAIHCHTKMLDSWEILNLENGISSCHELTLDRYCHRPDDAEITLVPPPLSLVAQPWFGELLRLIDPLNYNLIADTLSPGLAR